jgi:glycosyltransferase involved in cell wall biosynthesis
MLVKLLRHTDHTRIHSRVVSLAGAGPLAREIEALGVPVTSLGMVPGRISVGAMRRLVALLRADRPDVLQTWLYHADLLGTIAGRLAGVRSIYWNVRCAELDRDDHARSLFWMLRALAWLSPRVTGVVVNSDAGRRASESLGYRPKRWVMIRNGFELDRFTASEDASASVRAELGVAPDRRLVGLVARFHPMKDHATFLRAAGIVRRTHSDVDFVLAGRQIDSSNATLRALVDANGLAGGVHLLGERHDIPRLTASFDVAACSSYSEAFPNAVGEAMACAVPCVATAVGDCADVIGDTGEIVPPRDPAALAAAVRRLLDLPDGERRALGARARERVMTRYDIVNVAAEYARLYKELLGRYNPGRCTTT